MEMKGNWTWSWDWRGEERAGISLKNSRLDVEEDEGDRREKLRSNRPETGEGESWIGESGGKGENIGDTGSYLEGEGNLSSDERGNMRGRRRIDKG